MDKKLFTEKQTSVSAALTGPIPAGILIYMNYKALSKDREAYISLGATLIFTVLLFYAIFQIPEEIIDKIPSFLFTALYGVLVYLFYHNSMAADVQQAMDAGAKKGSNWAVAGFSVLGFVLNLAIIFGLAMDQPFYEGEVVKIKGNELYYSPNVPEADVHKLLNQFETQDFFGQDYGNIARLELLNDEYHITMVVDEQLWTDENIISYVTSLKWLMEDEFDKQINLKLESTSLTGDSKFKYITR